MKARVLGKFFLVALVFCVGALSQRPSSAEFNLFCRILAKANDLMYGPDYVYNENVDKEIIKEMTVLYNATTDNMKEFRKTLWATKDFFEAHPPPMDAKNRQEAHREIGKLIDKGEKKIEENKKIGLEVNKKMHDAKVSVAQGIFGDKVTEVPQDEKNLTGFLGDTGDIFNDKSDVKKSCGNGETKAGKTLINDLFCVCVGEGGDSEGPCHTEIWPPRSWYGCNGNCKWTLIKFGPDDNSNPPKLIKSLSESFKKIEHVCREEMMQNSVKSKDMAGLLDEYVGMIWNGTTKDAKEKKIFGHSERKKKDEVTQCDGTKGSNNGNKEEKNNNHICVDYTKNKEGDKYEIPWHNKFKNYTTLLKDAKQLENQILKNRADLLLLKTEAWAAYNRESDDETSNLDDMNVSNLLDGVQLPSFFLSYLAIFL
ncbi:Variant surface glycoprotein [Trypanosoma congolense IL3000]|uniref:Variant surface glycoprotein n=1 Tax=Trypanosoma congolense (strain IL3000) TaxID=1068625 RepID=F9WE11_TRYCI|nr:Variant surface glycoprotein [Trypanosoma congolense IL3000]